MSRDGGFFMPFGNSENLSNKCKTRRQLRAEEQLRRQIEVKNTFIRVGFNINDINYALKSFVKSVSRECLNAIQCMHMHTILYIISLGTRRGG